MPLVSLSFIIISEVADKLILRNSGMFRKNKLLKNNRKNNNYNGRSSARIDVIEIYNSRVNYINEEDWSEIVAQLSHNPFHYKFYSKISNITSLICKKTKLHQMVTSTAMVFFHKFYSSLFTRRIFCTESQRMQPRAATARHQPHHGMCSTL